ncbi:chymotrypsin-like protease CTRL-1 [Oryzias latipes]|uniref:chymotrypsin-like protease CTRL-1 n=1 Tax=Oryzias latipes TaxID=8090 RepID=UPI000CE19074|nr:chymotrypsin-like protease CTRL-1 [Oryzias latipes]
MALQQFVCRFTLMTLLLFLGCHPAVTDNSTVVENVSPGDSPWLVYFHPAFRCEGSLITDEWVLTDGSCVKPSDINNTSAFVGVRNRSSFPIGYSAFFSIIVCNIENKNGNNSGICLLRLKSPIRFSNNFQAISLASNMSTFDGGISSWVSVNDFISESPTIRTQREAKASILGSCKQNQSNVTEKEMRATIGGSYPCQVIPGSPLVIREQSQWILAGVAISTSASCGDPGVFSRVSWYQDWIREVVTGTKPTFVTVRCTPTTPDDSIFSGGSNLIHFTHFFSLSTLVLFVHVLVCGNEI